MEVSHETHEKIKFYCNEGDLAVEDKDFQDAHECYNKAWELIPDPKEEWEASTWVLAALADVYFFTENYQHLKNSLDFAMHCPNGLGNSFLHMRLGQAELELGNEERAKDELARALMGAGKEIFENDDPKYFEYISQFMSPPAGQESW